MARRKRTTTTTTSRSVGYRLGFRSGLEERVSKQITKAGLELLYETDKIGYVVPARDAKYTPDFKLPKERWLFLRRDEGHMDSPRQGKTSALSKSNSQTSTSDLSSLIRTQSCIKDLPPHTLCTVRSITSGMPTRLFGSLAN